MIAALAALALAQPTPAPATTTHVWVGSEVCGWTRQPGGEGIEVLDVEIQVPQHSPDLPPIQWIRFELTWEYSWLWRLDSRPGSGEWTARLPAATHWAEARAWLVGVDQLQGGAHLLDKSGRHGYALDPWDLLGSIYEPAISRPCGESAFEASVYGYGIGDGAYWLSAGTVADALTGYSTARVRIEGARQHLAEVEGCTSVRSRLLGTLAGDAADAGLDLRGAVWRPTFTIIYHY